MPSHDTPSDRNNHVAVFPPRASAGSFLEIWADEKPLKAESQSPAQEMSRGSNERGQEDPERWDGMS
ncbi:MAG TPA: hypothetical protein VG269_01795 [Tepidisphaeraceae bacterium]|jgi:hypothetical protein|nr:hypothetical protein [Tepidisphaeraceae bacterium]